MTCDRPPADALPYKRIEQSRVRVGTVMRRISRSHANTLAGSNGKRTRHVRMSGAQSDGPLLLDGPRPFPEPAGRPLLRLRDLVVRPCLTSTTAGPAPATAPSATTSSASTTPSAGPTRCSSPARYSRATSAPS